MSSMAYRLQELLHPAALDAILAEGWYRSGQHIFTTDWLEIQSEGISTAVYWARVDLHRWQPPRRYRRLAEAARREGFTVSVSADASITPEMEAMYESYLKHTALDAGRTPAAVLLDGADENYFPTRCFTIRHGETLIGTGFLDEGGDSTAGILNFYHPAYRHFSIGLLLYFEEIRRSAAAGKRWYYPGYIATGYPRFDYKLLAGEAFVEILDPEEAEWVPYPETVLARRKGRTV